MKKLITSILIITLLLTQFTGIIFAENGESTYSNIVSVISDKTSVKTGEKITFNIEVEEIPSGIMSLFVEWQLKTDSSKSLNKQWDNKNSIDQYEYTLPDNALPGEYEAKYVSITDNLHNYRTYSRNDIDENISLIVSKFDFTVEDTGQDTEGPVVTNVRKVTTNFKAPGEYKIQYDVTDEKSGVKDHCGGATYGLVNSLSDTRMASCQKISGNTYEATFYVESQYEKYAFLYIQACDNAGNWKNYTKEDLGITDELDIIPSNYVEDKTAPKLKAYSFDRDELTIPDYVMLNLDIEENEAGLGFSLGSAWFEREDGEIVEKSIRQAIDENGLAIENKGSVRIDFIDSETFTGKIYLNKITIEDKMKNSRTYSVQDKTLEKIGFSVSKIEKHYTLTTSTTERDYIEQISRLPEGSTVLCNVLRQNQIIKKELFDTIKGKDIIITFMSLYNGNGEMSSAGGISSSDTNTGIQWIINGKDIINETKNVDMKITFENKYYSKYIIKDYEINKNLEEDFWKDIYFSSLSDEELEKKSEELIELQKAEITKYLNHLKENGYIVPDELYEKAFEEIKYGADCETAIIFSNDEYIKYLSMEFEENGLLPCKTIIRMKPNFALRALIGTKNLIFYYNDGNKYDLIDNDINMDSEGYFNFTITHNSEYVLTNAKFGQLEKVDNTKPDDNKVNVTTKPGLDEDTKQGLDETPKSGIASIIEYIIPITVIAGIAMIAIRKKFDK